MLSIEEQKLKLKNLTANMETYTSTDDDSLSDVSERLKNLLKEKKELLQEEKDDIRYEEIFDFLESRLGIEWLENPENIKIFYNELMKKYIAEV